MGDLRRHNLAPHLPDQFGSVGIEQDGEVYLIEGTRKEMTAAIKAAGYRVYE